MRIDLPAWTPPAVLATVRWIAAHPLPPDQADILGRLATDPRMQAVWVELTRCDRTGGAFMHPARPPAHAPARSPVDAQADALGELLHFTWATAASRRSVSKPAQVDAERAALLARAAVLREIADSRLGAANAAALHQVAECAESAIALLRLPSDPLMIVNDRGDPVTRGVQVTIAVFLADRFGSRMDRTAATLASVALGARTTARATRSAFSDRKPA